jgi:hypothetical protein
MKQKIVPPKRVEDRHRKLVRLAVARRERAAKTLDVREREYRETLNEAMKAGIPATMLANWLGLSWQRIYQLVPLRKNSGARPRPRRSANGKVDPRKDQGAAKGK